MKARLLIAILLLVFATAAQAQGPGGSGDIGDPIQQPETVPETPKRSAAYIQSVKNLTTDEKALQFYSRVTPTLCRETCRDEFYFLPQISWVAPKASQDVTSYRVSWSVGRNWRGLGKSNTARRGNMIVQAGSTSNFVTLPAVKIKAGETLYIRTRARFCCGVKGPWSELTMTYD